MGGVGKRGVEAFLWCHGAHVAGRGLRDNAGNLAWVLRKCLAHGLDIVIRNDDGIGRRRARNARGIRQRKGRHAGAGRGQQRIHVAVVAALELQDFGAAGVAAGQAHRRHGGLGAGVNHAHLIGRGARDDGLREQSLTLGGRAEAQATRSGLLHGLHNLWVRIAVNHRAIGANQVNVLVAVDVPQARARTALNHASLATHGAKRAHRRVHPARNHLGGTLKPLLRLGSIRHVCHSSDSRAIQKLECAIHSQPLNFGALHFSIRGDFQCSALSFSPSWPLSASPAAPSPRPSVRCLPRWVPPRLPTPPPGSPLPARSLRATCLGRTPRFPRRRPSRLRHRPRRPLLRLVRVLAQRPHPSSGPRQRPHRHPARNLRRRPHAHLRGTKAACRT